MQNLKNKNKTEIPGRQDIPFIILIDITFVQDVVSQELLLSIQLWVVPIIPQVFLSTEASSVIKYTTRWNISN